ncbi:hypothetical protein SYNPS1DRAFT_24357 [Syncephalis pseudoplumigaleata]|uniref:Uncharacterized protein n=1 Tax=Syncephalis pseudoplumigaleata TaxID=1712513 RepID=A0A4P9YUE6_9FUNG|nr:hypothetical protein SYNPS1DRAFT_24357 [Syncephalis pseudoplumigaleata]|eukprot:RKP23577.1 hypothetical protein SYNPS1DRAFT_24357 [Syncephalis pseudoplumigaleata]
MERSKVAVAAPREAVKMRSPAAMSRPSDASTSIFSSLADMVSRARANANKEFDELCAYLTRVFGTQLKYFDLDQSMYDSQLNMGRPTYHKTVRAPLQRPMDRGINDSKQWANNTLRTEPLIKDPLRANGRGGIVKRAPLAPLTNRPQQASSAHTKHGVPDQVRALRQVLKQNAGKEGSGSSRASLASPFVPKHELKRSALQVVSKAVVPLATGNTPKKPVKRTSQPPPPRADSMPSLATVFAGETPGPSRPDVPVTARRVAADPECNTQMAGRTPKRARLFDLPAGGIAATPMGNLDPFSFDTPGDQETRAVEQWLKSTSSKKQVEPDTLASPPPEQPRIKTRVTPRRTAGAAASNRVHAIMESYRKTRRTTANDAA